MKLVHPDYLFQINMQESFITKLVIENPKVFSAVVQELMQQIEGGEGRFVLSDNNEIIEISENVFYIIDPFSLDINQKKVLTKIYSLLKDEIISTELFLKTNQLFSEMKLYMEEIIEIVDYPLTYLDEIDINMFFKFMNVRVESLDGDILEQLIDYIKIMQQVLGYSVVVLINIKAYLETSEIVQLYKFASYQKISLIMIESNEDGDGIADERVYIIDKDCCEIY